MRPHLPKPESLVRGAPSSKGGAHVRQVPVREVRTAHARRGRRGDVARRRSVGAGLSRRGLTPLRRRFCVKNPSHSFSRAPSSKEEHMSGKALYVKFAMVMLVV